MSLRLFHPARRRGFLLACGLLAGWVALDAPAAPPASVEPIARFTDNGNGTVTDRLTGLIWLKNANCFGLKLWTAALSSANGLASGSCGLSDGSTAGQWRLPSINEFQSLIDYTRSYPTLPADYATYFTGVQSSNYWSSTTYAPVTSYAWLVYLSVGDVYANDKTNTLYVWPVRGGQ